MYVYFYFRVIRNKKNNVSIVIFPKVYYLAIYSAIKS